jgi:hypothetical protein
MVERFDHTRALGVFDILSAVNGNKVLSAISIWTTISVTVHQHQSINDKIDDDYLPG